MSQISNWGMPDKIKILAKELFEGTFDTYKHITKRNLPQIEWEHQPNQAKKQWYALAQFIQKNFERKPL